MNTLRADIVKIETFPSHSRLSFPALQHKAIQYTVTRKGFKAVIPGISLTDWGVPFGEEKEFQKKVSEIKDHRVREIQIAERSGNIEIAGTWTFAEGEDAPVDRVMENYHYVKEGLARAHFDFWQRSGMSVKQSKVEAQRRRESGNLLRAQEEARKRIERRIARVNKKDDFSKIVSFCNEPLSESKDMILHFQPLATKVDFGVWFPKNSPDDGFTYSKMAGAPEETAYVKLALKLAEDGKFALVIKTIDFFFKDYPRTKAKEEMMLLKSGAFYKLGLLVESESVLKDIISTPSSTNVALQALLYMAGKTTAGSTPLAAFEIFSRLAHRFPESELSWVFRLGVAENLALLKQTDRAAIEYEWLSKNSKKPEIRALASFRLGDLFMMRREYSKAVGRYFQSFKEFPNEAKKSVSARLNFGEALYWVGQYDRAKTEFKSFLSDLGSHSDGWRATIRLGEIASRTSKDAKGLEEATQWYTESVNRFPLTIGARLARLMAIPCGTHMGLSWDAAKRTLQTIRPKPEDETDIPIVDWEHFFAFQYMRSAITLAPSVEAYELAFEQLSPKLMPIHRRLVDGAIASLFRKEMNDLVNAHKITEAIRFFEENYDSVQETLVASGTPGDFLLKAASLAADKSLTGSAYQLIKAYQTVESRISREVASDDVDVKLEQSEDQYVLAKVLWLKFGLKKRSEILKALEKVIDPSPYSYDREVILGMIDEKEGRTISALKHAFRSEVLMPAGIRDQETPRIRYWVYRVQRANHANSAASMTLAGMKEMITKAQPDQNSHAAVLGLTPLPSYADFLLERGDLSIHLNQWGLAEESFKEILTKDPENARAQVQFALSRFRLGDKDVDGALRKSLEKIVKTGREEVWKKMASEVLKGQELKSKAKEGRT